jgi:hypothetical protein
LTLYVWPWRLLTPQKFARPRLASRVTQGPPALSGAVEVNASDGGGRWTFGVSGVALADWETVRIWDAWTAHLRGGARPFVMPFPSLGTAPRAIVGGQPALPGKPAPITDIFGQDPSFGAPLIVASLHSSAALGASSLVIDIATGSALRGGELLALEHATVGWRSYQVGRVTARTGMQFTVDIEPPLREAASSSAAVEFDMPRCVMALDPSAPGDMGPGEVSRFDEAGARFVEWFGDI